MYSTTFRERASKETVSILSSNARLQLRLNYDGKRHYIFTGTGLATDEIVLMFLMPLLRSQPPLRELRATPKRGHKFAHQHHIIPREPVSRFYLILYEPA